MANKLFFSLLYFICGSSLAAIEVEQPLIKLVPPSFKNTAGFMTIKNTSNEKLKLIEASSSIAKFVELHTHSMEKGVMKMRKVNHIEIPAHKSVRLKPHGLHIMFIGLTQQISGDQYIPVELKFENGFSKKINFRVKRFGQHKKIR